MNSNINKQKQPVSATLGLRAYCVVYTTGLEPAQDGVKVRSLSQFAYAYINSSIYL